MVARRRFSRRLVALAAALALLGLYHFVALDSSFTFETQSQSIDHQRPSDANSNSNPIPSDADDGASFCPPMEGMDDILVVMKTGVTEAKDKVPVHFKTTLRCVPNYIIYSDFEEEIEGVKIYDVLQGMDPDVMKQVPDFDLYNRIKKLGRQGLAQDDFADEANSAVGKPNNPGWKLDKWKFLPMIIESLRYRPKAKWYVFMEADTYISWPTLLQWLKHFDHRKPWYLGTETQIADVIFAHGGSGFMISHPALKLAAEEYTARRTELHHYTDGHWAGDCVLGKVLADAGVNLHFSWPILQNSNLGELDEFNVDLYRQPWCFIAAAFHHLNARQIQDLWAYEQKRWHDKNKRILLHSDVFRDLLYPEMVMNPARTGWDNLSTDEQAPATSFEECRQICNRLKECTQFSFRDQSCFTNRTPRLGSAHSNAVSGWLVDRIRDKMEKSGFCKSVEWGGS
ncbi:N-acetylgalactosaminide beta-1,3-galactosyltransferase [Penicillium ucsense]|uniref:N-acetylgalactosaminide beta-1,3-galactosyltransferase n=1 Tax=Penicillium ucsense TaxID=2839758 RepID=A0A8J8W809_9EURO|nr:N-acetylgalactosaminide beta-1,3-galactosyltransferase [Penicillium ucsense]KAF7737192.1 N-acetylgalactosaminide beta-1,3-galactosyltransferase [Penicillium ucsense]